MYIFDEWRRLRFQPRPAVRAEGFQRLETRFVVHLVAAVDPVAEIDIRQPARSSRPRCDRGSCRCRGCAHLRRDGRSCRPSTIRRAERPTTRTPSDWPSLRFAVFHDVRFDRRFFHHRDVVEQSHVRHAAAGVARVEIGTQQGKLFACGFCRHFGADELRIALFDAPLAPRRREQVGRRCAPRRRPSSLRRPGGRRSSGCGGIRNG